MMQQFAFHVQQRLVKKPCTINFFHSTLPDGNYICFHPKSLFGQGKEGPISEKVKNIAAQLNTSFNFLWVDIDIFLKYTPYSLLPSAPIRLQSGAPNTPFTKFLKHALLHHPSKVIRSLRHGKDKTTAPSFFFAFWVSHYAIKPYFTVCPFCFHFTLIVILFL